MYHTINTHILCLCWPHGFQPPWNNIDVFILCSMLSSWSNICMLFPKTTAWNILYLLTYFMANWLWFLLLSARYVMKCLLQQFLKIPNTYRDPYPVKKSQCEESKHNPKFMMRKPLRFYLLCFFLKDTVPG